MNRNRLTILILVVCLIGATVTTYFAIPSLQNRSPGTNASVCKNGPYDARATYIGNDELGKPLYNLTYDKNGVHENGLYYSFSTNALSWIINKTSTNSTFLNWWDYGKEIIGCTGRNSVVSNPSSQLISLGFTQNTSEEDSDQSIMDVANALFSTNSSIASSIASRYRASYLFVTTEDGGEKAPYMLQLLGLKSVDYLTPSGKTFDPKDWTSLGQQTVIYRLLTGQNIAGFNVAYSDAYVSIFVAG